MPYDFNDHLVYDLIKRTHLPEETGGFRVENATGQSVAIEPLRLVCQKDGEGWPCTAVRELRAFDEKRLRSTTFPSRAPETGNPQRGTRG